MSRPPAWAACLLAPNAGPMTLDGTNTWLLRSAGHALVVDPGPDDPRHLDAVAAAAQAGGAAITGIVLTHRHDDHRAGLPGMQARTGGALLTPGDGDTVSVGDLAVEAVATPGHTDDSRCLLVTPPAGPPVLVCGDTVLGRGTSVIAWPDGDVGDYLASLARLERLVADRAVGQLLPGHGPVVDDPAAVLAYYRRHRQERLGQVRAARAGGARTPEDVVAIVYPDLDAAAAPVLHGAALRTVRATLAYLDRPDPAGAAAAGPSR